MIALRKQLGGLVAPLMVLALAACESPSPTGTGDAAPSAPAFVLRDQDSGETPANVALLNNHFKLCKVGPDPSFVATFQVTEIRYPGTPQEVVTTQQIKLKAGTCKWVATNSDDPIIQVEELLPPGVRVDYIEVRTKGLVKTSAASPPTEYAKNYIIDDESSMEELIGRTAAGVYPEYSHAGAVAIFHNTTTPPPAPKLEISKTAGAASVAAGQPISFSITVSNTGDGDATDVVVSDPLPGGLGIDWSIAPAVAGCSITGTSPQLLSCSFAGLAAGQSRTVTVQSATTAASCQVYDNTATASADGLAPVSDDARVSVTCPPPPTGVCSGGVSKLVVKYIGTTPLAGQVRGQRRNPQTSAILPAQTAGVGANTLYTFAIQSLGGLFSPAANGRLANEFTIFIGSTAMGTVHTSCSQPIYPGMVIAGGLFEIVEVHSVKGGQIGAP